MHVNGGEGKAAVLVSAMKGLTVPKPPECGRHLLDGMGLRVTGVVDHAPPHGLVTDNPEQQVEDRPWTAEMVLKRVLAVDRGLPVHTKLASQILVRT